MVKDTLIVGDVIEDYPDDEPFPSALFLGSHVLVPFFSRDPCYPLRHKYCRKEQTAERDGRKASDPMGDS